MTKISDFLEKNRITWNNEEWSLIRMKWIRLEEKDRRIKDE